MKVLVEGKEVALQEGVADVAVVPGSASVETYRIFGEPVYGELSADGVMDAVYYLTKETGGSGTFFYAVFALGSESGYVGKEAVFLGDRIAPQNINIIEGDAVANFAERAPGESFAVPPSIGKSVYLHYDIATDTVGEVVQDFEGEADASRLTLTTKEWEWVKTEYAEDSCTCPAGYTQTGDSCDPACRNSNPPCMAPSIACESPTTSNGAVTPKTAGAFTLTFTGEGTVAIGTDCNSMSGTYEKAGSGSGKQSFSFGPIASTMMYCEGSQEQDFSGMLTKTNAYAFTSKGELLLYQGEESVATFR
jgi:heat shock protein HslJ